MPTRRYRAAILDVDGTLVDSNDQHAHAWVDVLAEHGHPVLYTATRRLIGKGGDKLVAELTGLADDDPRVERIGARRGAIFAERYLPAVRALPGSRALVERLREAGLLVAVASSAKRDELEPLLDLARVADLLDGEATSSDADRSKPDPDIVAAALRRLGVAPGEAVMIGDTPYDIEAAHAAGIATIAVRSGGWSAALLAAAIAIYDGPAQLCAGFATSPLGR
jgi:HAD superfamily hydrolase (TIGR01509 family)